MNRVAIMRMVRLLREHGIGRDERRELIEEAARDLAVTVRRLSDRPLFAVTGRTGHFA